MNLENKVTKLTYQEMVTTSGGGPVLRILGLYAWYNRALIWENTVGAYIDGFRQGFAEATQ